MKIYYVANTRMPNEWAHGIQIAKMCEAFIAQGIDLTLVVPNRAGTKESLKTFYHLSVDIPVVRLPVMDMYRKGSKAYRFSSMTFMCSYVVYLWWKKLRGEQFILYTVDLDNYSSSLLTWVPAPLYSEMHGGKKNTVMQKILFSGLTGYIATNPITAQELKETFSFSHALSIIEPNGVDVEKFAPIDKREARTILGLPEHSRIVLYSGRLIDWKGLPILSEAAGKTPSDVKWYIVGGTKELYLRTSKLSSVPACMEFMGSQPHSIISTWLSAADVLVVLGTKYDEQSYRWTSPMKLFEYLLSERPIVAARTPAITSVVTDEEVFFYEPDAPESLARAIEEALTSTSAQGRTTHARTLGLTFNWRGRGSRITKFMGI